ncbi:MAG: alanine--tRNA ligase-related protein [Candidatus Woesearchaeota archaeon]|jgi:alanyl-tRNA synthetase|nr:alanine--tRNA ligase-related protein [Candidatus Woesearchaeota archaeon]
MNIPKLIKKQIIEEASSNPEKYFPVKTLEEFGLKRQKCSTCSCMFWSSVKREVCGDSNCVGTYTFIGETPATRKMEFAETYQLFREFLEKRGYMHVERFPIVARWRDDLDFNIASIIGFQPYVTKGIVAPPAELVTIPQNCLRFGDIDNVGYTGRHGTNFVMIGQCAFKKPEEYDQAKYMKDLYDWFTVVMGIPKEELQIHEDAWVGGGDCGPSMEFFSRGLELGNQVYMWFDMSNANDISEIKPLKLKVLDMGMGLERCCWFSKGSINQYEASMPVVSKYLFEKTGLKPNWEVYNKFLPYSGILNLDETDDIDKAWINIAKKIGLSVDVLKEEVEPVAGIYSIADHTKTLLYALADGALPSNVKGGYNLRLVLRRALDFIYKFNWDINLFDVIVLQAEEVKDLYPEFVKELDGIKKIIDLEVKKYIHHKEKVENKIKTLIKKDKNLSTEEFIKYYISDGITPDEFKESFEKQGKIIEIPANFFTLVAEFFESRKASEQKVMKNKLTEFVEGIPETKLLFYADVNKEEEDAEILKEFEFDKSKYIILDKTLFYPTMGGQASDVGYIGEKKVIEAIKVGSVVVHKLYSK